MPIETLIVDDEPLARRKIRRLLSNDPDFEVVGEAGNGGEAIAAIEELGPDLMFLDVQMPEIDGFDVIERVAAQTLPAIVFVTAYNQHAVRAFEVHALDYLVKPFDRRRFEATLKRARQHLALPGGIEKRVLAALSDVRGGPGYLDRVLINESDRAFFVAVDKISWVEAYGNYVRLHLGKETYLLRETMTNMEKALDPRRFSRIHRSVIVNVDRIKELQKLFHGDYQVVLDDGTELRLSRTYRDRLTSTWGKGL